MTPRSQSPGPSESQGVKPRQTLESAVLHPFGARLRNKMSSKLEPIKSSSSRGKSIVKSCQTRWPRPSSTRRWPTNVIPLQDRVQRRCLLETSWLGTMTGNIQGTRLARQGHCTSAAFGRGTLERRSRSQDFHPLGNKAVRRILSTSEFGSSLASSLSNQFAMCHSIWFPWTQADLESLTIGDLKVS